jgi:hypothetical protein
MNAILRKEIRLLLPAWSLAMAMSTLPIWARNGRILSQDFGATVGTLLVFFAAGALLLSLSSFGAEMSFGTFPALLAQPRPRSKTWRMKIGVLASALALVVAASVFSFWLWKSIMLTYAYFTWREYACCLLSLALMAIAGGLWTTLLFRQLMTAFWCAILVPVLLVRVSWPVAWVVEDVRAIRFTTALGFLSCSYAILGYFLARWLFFHAQDKPERETTDAVAWSFLPGFRTRRRPVTALVVKELRLQQGTLVIAAGLLVLHLAAVAVPEYFPPAVLAKYPFFYNVWMIWFLAPLLVSCGAIAEERRGRTLESTLCLPMAEHWQFAIKMLVVFGLGIFLGAVLPWLLELLRAVWGMNAEPIKENPLPKFALAAAGITAIGCYGSSMSDSFLQAFGAAVLLGVALIVAFGQVLGNGNQCSAVLIAVCLCLSYANFKQLRMTWTQGLRNASFCLLVLVAAKCLMLALAGIFLRGQPLYPSLSTH